MSTQDFTRSSRAPTAVLAAAAAAAVALGALAAVAPPKLTVAAILALAIVSYVAAHPPGGAYVLLAASPLLAGLERGLLLPLLRPHEAIALLVAVGLLAHAVVAAATHTRARLRFPFGPLDRALLLLAVTGSIVPLIVMVIRDRPIEQDDILYALQLWKYYALFVMIRACVRTPQEVRRCLWVILGASAIVAAIGIAQVLHVPFVASHITSWFVADDANQLERGQSTLASSIAVGDVMVFSLAIAAGMLLRGDRHRWLLGMVSVLFVFGTLATGQFSAIIALVVGVLAFGWITGRLSVSVIAMVPPAAIGAFILRPVIEQRLSGFQGGHALPKSWQARLDNVTTYFWPVLEEQYNWLLGVRPLARVNGPAYSGIEYIWIESGHVWLLWTGGIPFALAFLWFMWVALRTVARIARERLDIVGVAAGASFTALCVNLALMALDPHLTLRGSADLSFALLALTLALVGVGRRARAS